VERAGLEPASPACKAGALPIELSSHQELVPGVGFEPTSPRLQRGAITRSASQAVLNWCGRGESNSFRRSGAPALNQSTTSAESSEKNWCAPEDLNLSSADLPVSQTPVLQTGGRRGTRSRMAEGEGVEPSTRRSARFSGPVACRHAPPSELVVPARLERATPAVGKRCSAPLSYGTKMDLWYAQEESNLQPRSGPELTTGISRPLCQLSYGRTKWSGWLDSNQRPPASEAGTLAGLSYTLLALRREIESLSPDRQSGRLTRCVTEQKKKMVRLGRLERPLNALSTHSLCRLGYRRAVCELEDQAGFEPAVSLRCRLKRPARSAATVTGPTSIQDSFKRMEDPGGYDPLADGLKGRSLSIRV
jgi:hypothetical protein